MCSINGVFSLSSGLLPSSLLEKHRNIASKLIYRGPDRSGEYHDERCGLFVNQHNITELSSNVQPVTSEDGEVIAVLNGEVYNYRALNRDLKKRGYNIRTTCDTETLLRLYQEYGTGCFDKIHGMFACAFYDKHKKCLFLGRDRFGEKPLFYLKSNDLLHFCSESNYLVNFSKNEMDEEGLLQYLTFGFSLDHIITGIKRLKPGTFLVVNEKGIETYTYWKPIFVTNYSISPKEAVSSAYDILKANVYEMIPQVVPYGAYVSGGVDSSVIAKLLSKKKKNLDLFTSGLTNLPLTNGDIPVEKDYSFVETQGNEFMYTDQIAASIDGRYHKREFTVKDFCNHLPDMVSHLPGGPVLSTSFPLIYFSAKQSKGFRVCFSGEGSDELLGGYKTSQPEFYEKSITHSFIQMGHHFNESQLDHFLGNQIRDRYHEMCERIDREIERDCQCDSREQDVLFNKIRFFMLRYVFCPHILEKADGMTMGKAPTELRMPYLSVPYAEFALTMPLSLCRFEGRRKYICFQLAKRLKAPGIIVKRTQKQRTSLPYYHLFFNSPDFQEYVHSLLNEHSRLKEYIKIKNPGAYINSLKNSDNGHRCAWALLILEIWLQQNFNCSDI